MGGAHNFGLCHKEETIIRNRQNTRQKEVVSCFNICVECILNFVQWKGALLLSEISFSVVGEG